jgi:hypothetical protein
MRRYRGVSKKKGKWEAKVMVNRKWAYRELFDSEEEAARAYDDAVWRLKPKEAKSYINFKERYGCERGGRGGGAAAGSRLRPSRHASGSLRRALRCVSFARQGTACSVWSTALCSQCLFAGAMHSLQRLDTFTCLAWREWGGKEIMGDRKAGHDEPVGPLGRVVRCAGA